MDLEFNAKNVSIAADTYSSMTVSAEKVEKSDILNHFTIADIIEHFDDDKILDHIGQERVQQYFDLIPNE